MSKKNTQSKQQKVVEGVVAPVEETKLPVDTSAEEVGFSETGYETEETGDDSVTDESLEEKPEPPVDDFVEEVDLTKESLTEETVEEAATPVEASTDFVQSTIDSVALARISRL